MVRFTILALGALLLNVFSTYSQSVTGDLIGKILTTGGTPVEGANIVIRSESLQGTRGVTSQSNGAFAFVNLPVGLYSLSITHVAFRPLDVMGIRISLGSTFNTGPLLIEEGSTDLEEVVISDSGISYRSEISERLAKDRLDNLPVERDFKSAITLLPQVNTSYFGDGLSINGATGAENMFYLNGINVTDNFSSQWAPTLNSSSFIPYNFIKEVNIKEGGYSAEYGRALGGIVDVVTQSGSNKFSGQLFTYYSGSFLNANTEGGTTGSTIGKTSNYDAGFSFGGPIIRNRLWYFTAYSYYQNTRETDIGGLGYYPDKTTAHLFALKVDWKVSEKTALDATILADPTKSTPIMTLDASGSFIPDIIENPDAMWAETTNGGINAAITLKSEIARNTVLEASLSGYKRRVDFSGATDYGDVTPQFSDLTTGSISGGIGYIEDYDISRQNSRIKISRHEENHFLRAGVELESNSQRGTARYPQQGDVFKWADNEYTLYKFSSESDLKSYYLAAFYQHDWQVSDRVLIEAGIRYEKQQLLDGKGEIFQTFDNQWQPRLGLNWFIDNDLKKKLSFNYGRVYQSIPLLFNVLYSTGTDNYYVLVTEYDSDPLQPGSVPSDTSWYYSGYTVRTPYNKHIFNSNYGDQFAIQYQQQVSNGLRITARLFKKILRDAFMVGVDTSFNVYTGNPGKADLSFLPKVKQEYTAFEIGILGKNAKSSFVYGVYYVWSRNYGTYSGFWDPEARYYSLGALTSSMQTSPDRVSNMNGLLPNDRTHSIKLNATYKFGFGLVAGTNFMISSGTPLNEYIPNKWNPFSYDLLVKRGSVGRLEPIWDLSFRFSYQRENLPFRVSMDFFHVWNPQNVVDQVQLKFNDPEGTNPNPAYGKAVRRQPPMYVRFGFEYNF
jgi:outer membrane receptor for ferrienterochelin and colicin